MSFSKSETDLLKYRIAMLQIPDVGDMIARNLISYCGGAEKIFAATESKLKRIPGVGEKIARNIIEFNGWAEIEEEIKFIEKHKIQTLFYTDEAYPKRLKNYSNTPVLLFYKGNCNLNSEKIIAMVGTRNATDYGKKWTEKFIEEISPFKPVIVSGLAFGIDIYSHKAALKNNIETIGVLAHGLNKIYPPEHKSTAEKMISQGGLLTEYTSKSKPDREHFPDRNRIVAAMSDAIIVVESKEKGGSLITANFGNNFNKDVFAVPGKSSDANSRGCNFLIKSNQAMLIENAADFILQMGWADSKTDHIPVQKNLFVDLDELEQKVMTVLNADTKVHLDELIYKTGLSSGKMAAVLLGLEMKFIITALPGKMYKPA